MFINRTEELRQLYGEINGVFTRNKVIFLCGGTGVGKSALSDRVLQRESSAIGIKVVVPAGEHAPGTYIRLIARHINELSSKANEVPSLQWFLKNLPSKDLRRSYDSALLAVLAQAEPTGAGKLIETVTSRWFGRGQFDAARLFRESESEVIYLLVEYVRHVVGNRRVVLNIENFQCIDYSSLQVLEELMKAQRQQVLLAEWTPGQKTQWEFSNIRRIFESAGCSIHRFDVEVLSFAELSQLIPSSISNTEAIARLKKRYEFANGNLAEWFDFLESEARRLPRAKQDFLLPDGARDNPGATSERIAQMSKDAIFVLSCLAVHQGTASEDLLRLLTTRVLAAGYIDYEAARDELLGSTRVVEDGTSIRVSHDWIVTTIRSDPQFARYAALALNGWAELYNEMYLAEDYRLIGKSELLEHLFYFLAHTGIERLYGLIDDIKHYTLSSIYPRKTIGLLKNLQRVLIERYPEHPQAFERIGHALLDIYYGLGLYPEAFEVLGSLPQESARSTIYRALLLNRLDRHEEAVAFAGIAGTWCGSGFESVGLYLQLVAMMSLRSMNRKSEAREIFQKLINVKEYRNLPSYPYLLRNARLVISREEALPLLKESIVRFQQAGNEVDEGHSRIAMSMYLCMRGDLHAAHAELDKAGLLLAGRSMERHVRLNDLAVLRLLDSVPDLEDAHTVLNSARITITKRFDKIAVANNLLIVELLRRDTDAMRELEDQLRRELRKEPDLVLHRSVLYNLALSATTRGDDDSAAHFRTELAANSCARDAYWKSRIEGADGSSAYKRFFLRFPFHPVYLTNWHFPVVGC